MHFDIALRCLTWTILQLHKHNVHSQLWYDVWLEETIVLYGVPQCFIEYNTVSDMRCNETSSADCLQLNWCCQTYPAQVTKYKSRYGISSRDLLRLAHPKTSELGKRGRDEEEVDDMQLALKFAAHMEEEVGKYDLCLSILSYRILATWQLYWP